MEITRESIAQGVYEPKALSTALVHNPFATGWQYQINGSKAIFSPYFTNLQLQGHITNSYFLLQETTIGCLIEFCANSIPCNNRKPYSYSNRKEVIQHQIF